MKLQKSENDSVGNKNPVPTLDQSTSMALSQQRMDCRTVQIQFTLSKFVTNLIGAKMSFSASSILFNLLIHRLPVKTKRFQAILFRTFYQHTLDFLDSGE